MAKRNAKRPRSTQRKRSIMSLQKDRIGRKAPVFSYYTIKKEGRKGAEQKTPKKPIIS